MSGMGEANKKKRPLLDIRWAVYALWSLTTTLIPFHWQDWGPIEHFAAQGVIKDSIWTARMTRLGLKARIDIPVAGG